MKKTLAIIMMVFGFAVYANAQSHQCEIPGAEDGATVTAAIESCDTDKDEVVVGFYNDSDKSVTATATVSIGRNSKSTTAIVPPHSTTTKRIVWTTETCPNSIQIKSAKCKQ